LGVDKKMRAKNRKEFEEIWNSEFDNLYFLTESLPLKEATELLTKVKALKGYIGIAANHTFDNEGAYKK